MPKTLNTLDLDNNQLINLLLESLSSDPSSPSNGRIWLNTTVNALKFKSSAGIFALTYGLQGLFGGRLSLTPGVSVTTSDVSNAGILYWTPHTAGDRPTIEFRFDGTTWTQHTITEKQLVQNLSQPCSSTNGSAVLTGLSSTRQLVRGMQVAGTGIPGSTTISSVDSSTQITMSANATQTTTTSRNFVLAEDKNYDAFLCPDGVLQWGRGWTNNTTRQDALGTQDGVEVNNAAISSGDHNAIAAKTGVYLGTVRNTSSQLHDSETKRFVWNKYNRQRRKLRKYETADSWLRTAPGSWLWESWNSSTSNRVEFVLGMNDLVELRFSGLHSCNGGTVGVGIGLDSTSANHADVFPGSNSTTTVLTIASAEYNNYPGLGYHFLQLLQTPSPSLNTTFYGDIGVPNHLQGGATGWMCG